MSNTAAGIDLPWDTLRMLGSRNLLSFSVNQLRVEVEKSNSFPSSMASYTASTLRSHGLCTLSSSSTGHIEKYS